MDTVADPPGIANRPDPMDGILQEPGDEKGL